MQIFIDLTDELITFIIVERGKTFPQIILYRIFMRFSVIFHQRLLNNRSLPQRLTTFLLSLIIIFGFFLGLGTPTALASLTDDHYDGTIFTLYGGNGSLVPPKVTLADSFQRHKPALLVFYLDDSKDCKEYTTTVSQLQAYYGRAADFIPLTVDSLSPNPSKDPQNPRYYYQGFVPQTVLINQSGKVVFDEKGIVPFEKVDDVFREVFDLVPRSESVTLKRRQVNELNTELVP